MKGGVLVFLSNSDAVWDRGSGAWSSIRSRQKARNRVIDGGREEPSDSFGQELQWSTRWRRWQKAERRKPEPGTLLKYPLQIAGELDKSDFRGYCSGLLTLWYHTM